MKKILAALALLALVFGTAVAQDGELSVKGHLISGFQLDFDKDGSTISAYNDDAGRTFQAQVQFDYVTENSGVSVRLRADERSAFIPRPDNGHAYGWFNFLPGGIAQISGGILGNAKWGTFTDFYIDDSIDNRGYFKLAITPIEGLTFGMTTIAIDPMSIVDPASGDFRNAVSGLNKAFQGSVAGVKYVVPDTFGISAAFSFNYKDSNFRRLREDKDLVNGQNIYDTGSGGKGYAYGNFSTLFSAFYYGVENLKLNLDGYFGYDKEDVRFLGESSSAFGIGLQGNYQISEPLFAGIRVVFETQPAHEDATAFLEIRPQAGYTINEWLELGLKVPIGLQGTTKGLEDAALDVGVAPKATFTLNSSTKLEAWYTLGVTKMKDIDPEFTNAINLDLIWTF
jgi:hypothetical protein